jgi:hypothetical protein
MKEGNYIVFLKKGGVVKSVKNFVDPKHNGKMTTTLNAPGFNTATRKLLFRQSTQKNAQSNHKLNKEWK